MMLVLRRMEGDRIVVGCGIALTVVENRRTRVSFGMAAPQGIPIYRRKSSERLAREETGDCLYDHNCDGWPFSVYSAIA